jgi:ankyrin repeat protein
MHMFSHIDDRLFAVLASPQSDVEALRALLDAGADPNALYPTGRGGAVDDVAPLHLASGQNRPDHIACLLLAGADLSLRSRRMRASPLHYAALTGADAAARALIDAGISLNGVNIVGETALIVAARTDGAEDALHTLVNAGADLTLSDAQRRTALHWAVLTGSRAKTRTLLDAGANREARDRAGETPLDLAGEKARRFIAKWDAEQLLARIGALR